jgi:uncharacterized iron-regulated membrane protein
MASRLRKAWLTIHRWLGLTIGLFLAFSGLTGSLIVFHHSLDEWLNSKMMLSRNQGMRLSVAEIVAAAEKSSPVPGRIVNVFYPRVSNGVFTLYVREPEKSSRAETVEVFVDPVSAEILGTRSRESGGMAALYRLHSSILAGDSGRVLLGGLAILTIVSLGSGLMLWWPLIRKGVWFGFGIRRRVVTFDLHKSVGAIFAPILLLIAVTAVYLTLPGLIKPMVKSFSEETKLPGKVKSTIPIQATAPIGPDTAAQIAAETMPGCRLMSIELPIKADDSYRVFVRQQGEVGELRGVGRVWIDQYSGECLATRDWTRFTFADTFFRIQLALHSGDAFGIAGRWIFCLGGLSPTILSVTGFLMWRRKAKSRAGYQNRSRQAPEEATHVSRTVAAGDPLSIS